jgi:hypothetical protein
VNVMEEFCPVAPLFCSPEHLSHRREREPPGSGDVLDVSALAERDVGTGVSWSPERRAAPPGAAQSLVSRRDPRASGRRGS